MSHSGPGLVTVLVTFWTGPGFVRGKFAILAEQAPKTADERWTIVRGEIVSAIG